jgi:hypothetical protein
MGEDTNDYRTAEEVKAQKTLESLEGTAHDGALFADWSRSYCSIKLFAWLDEQIDDSRNRWLQATDREAAEAVRLQSQAYAKIKTWVRAHVKAGELASEGIKEFRNEGIELEGMIKPPTRE